jgi:hypothetical protein
MRRLLIVLLAVGLAVSLAPMKAAQAASLIKTEDGLEFKFGMAQKVMVFSMDGFDFTDDPGKKNFRSLSVPEVAIGNQQFAFWNFTNLLFDLSKGPVSIHANLEVEATMDENIADVNHLNLERANLTWKTGVIGDLVVGFDVHLFDPEGGLIYQDEDPGIWLIGSQGNFSWNLGYHKRLARNRCSPLANFLFTGGCPSVSASDTARSKDGDIFEARVGINFPMPGGNLSISPLFLYYSRNVGQPSPATGFTGNLVACPTGNCTTNPITGTYPSIGDDSTANIFFPGIVLGAKFGPVSLTAEAVGQFGEVENLGSTFTSIYGKNSVDIESFAVFGEIALDLTAQGVGLTPFVNVDWRRGDDKPLNDTLEGYVPISDLTAALRKDGFKFTSISSMGPPTLGSGGEAAWGFNTHGRGIGPSIGSILDGVALADTVFFNNRWGKGDNPGMLKVTGGMVGKINSQWDLKGAVSYIRFDTTESIVEEAKRNRAARTPSNPGSPLSVNEDAGVEINFNVGFSPVPALRIQPYASVFIPMEGADDINRLFLDNPQTRPAWLAGLEFRAQF